MSYVPLLDEPDWLLVIDVAVDGPAAKAFLEMNFLPAKCHAHFSLRVMNTIEISFLVIRQDALF